MYCGMGCCSAQWDSSYVLMGKVVHDNLILLQSGKGISSAWCLVYFALWKSTGIDRLACWGKCCFTWPMVCYFQAVSFACQIGCERKLLTLSIVGQLPDFCTILGILDGLLWGCPDANIPTGCVFRADSL